MDSFRLNDFEDLILEAPKLAEMSEIAAVFESNLSAVRWLDYRSPSIEAEKFVANHDLPPFGSADRSYRLVIRRKNDPQIVGILNYYCGHPLNENLYVGDIFIRSDHARKGLGSSIVAALEREAVANGATKIYVNLGLKNWPALRFWIARGYNQIMRITGDSKLSEATYASIEVAKHLKNEQEGFGF